MRHVDELAQVCRELDFKFQILSSEEARIYIEGIFNKFNPQRRSGHLAIGRESLSIPIEKYEFSYSYVLKNEPGFLFFDQENHNKNQVFVLEDGRQVCAVLESSYGMEYFLSNEAGDYLIAVNWYVIECAGVAKEWMLKLMKGSE